MEINLFHNLSHTYGNDVAKKYKKINDNLRTIQNDIDSFNAVLGFISVKRYELLEKQTKEKENMIEFSQQFPVNVKGSCQNG